MRIIDFRVRPPYKGFLDAKMYTAAARRDQITSSIGFEPSAAAQTKSMQLLVDEMDEAGVSIGVVVGRNSGALGVITNDIVKEVCDLFPDRFIPVASIDPMQWKSAPADIAKARSDGFRAIGLEPGGASIPMHTDDRKLYPLYSFCESEKIVLIIMTGGNAGPDISYTTPERLDRVLSDFPELKIVSSHGNWPWVHQILHVALRRPNLYLSPDYLLSNMPGMDDYVRAADTWLADQFLYASAFPFAPVKGYLDWFQQLPIRASSMEKILFANASRLLGIDVN
ncbi:MAG: amidohydrolase [Ferrovum sp. 34-44-207]|nr:MAG: amidohydrolase [Ferrovum sp. 34-44-207]